MSTPPPAPLWPLGRQLAAIAEGSLTPAALMAATRARARQFARFRAFSALDEAGGDPAPGPLAGATLAVKGNIPVAGLPHTEGSALHVGRIAPADAAMVAALRKAGAVPLGMTTLSELAMYAVENPFEPMGLNPWDVSRTAGGSSTGSGVAVALGLAALGLGTDTAGSVRNPAVHCGIVGFKPGFGVWDYAGVPVWSPSLDTLGLLGRRVDCVARGAAALGTPSGPPPPRLRLLVPARLVAGVADGATRTLFAAALSRLAAHGIALTEAEVPLWAEADAAVGTIALAEGGAALRALPAEAPIGAHLKARAALSAQLPTEQVAAARDVLARFAAGLQTLLDRVAADAVVTPGWPFAAPPIPATTVDFDGRAVPLDPARSIFMRTANAAGAPALVLPAGLYPAEGVPFALHLLGRRGGDGALLALAAQVEAALPEAPVPPVALTGL
ncbi:amidase [Falsiroseomonas oryzae]|uniref:amidase n=1 Tax=Falsiroseomonas oryzae TaxID=2766473 RepID=UPI0022EB411D|nr:amidase [Roseomonas sp. MO-31]